tara:strand:- start:2021 stop:2341 length:321 start_codon:yes stop_codon:yes gene_type:complete
MGTKIKFEDFKKDFMAHYDGYIPSYVGFDEEYESEDTCILNIEMFAPFRMADGPSRFFRIYSVEVDKTQLEDVYKYLEGVVTEHWEKEFGRENIKQKINDYTTLSV